MFNNRQTQEQIQVQRISLEDSTHSRLSHNIPGLPGPEGVILLSVLVLLCSTQIKFNDPLTSLYLSLCSLPPPSSLVPWGHRPITTPTSPACGTAVVTQHWPVPVSMATVPLRNPQHPQQPQGDSWTQTHTQHFRRLFLVKEGGDSPFFPSAGLTIDTQRERERPGNIQKTDREKKDSEGKKETDKWIARGGIAQICASRSYFALINSCFSQEQLTNHSFGGGIRNGFLIFRHSSVACYIHECQRNGHKKLWMDGCCKSLYRHNS